MHEVTRFVSRCFIILPELGELWWSHERECFMLGYFSPYDLECMFG